MIRTPLATPAVLNRELGQPGGSGDAAVDPLAGREKLIDLRDALPLELF